MMNRKRNLLNILTIVALVYTFFGVANAENRCVADLSRVDNSFCLSDKHIAPATNSLSYKWKTNDGVFDLTAKSCLSSSGVTGERQDIVIAIDRSFSMRAYDLILKKQSADTLSMARYIISKYESESGQATPRISLVMFSSSSSCSEYSGGGINVNYDFPCLYVPAGSAKDTAHVERLKSMLTAAQDLYSQGGTEKKSDYTIVSKLLSENPVRMNPVKGASLAIFSDGRTYSGQSGDMYANLRVANYENAQKAAISAFSSLKAYSVLFAMNPSPTPAYDDVDTYDTMCQLAGAADRDCKNGVNINNPNSWPVNQIVFKNFAIQLVSATGGTEKNVVTIMKRTDLDPGLEAIRFGNGNSIPLEAVSYSINGGASRAGRVDGERLFIESLPSDEKYSIELLVKAAGVEFKIPATIETNKIAPTNEILVDKEMQCTIDESMFSDPNLRLKNLQGGSASCGVVGVVGVSAHIFWFMFVVPLMLIAFVYSNNIGKFAILLACVGAGLFANSAQAEESSGLNVIQYHPVVDGAGMTEKATAMRSGAYNVGLFMDYANDAVEIGAEDGQRESSVMDDVVTAHMVANLGIMKNVSLGVNIPYVHKTDVDRSVQGEEIEGGNVGLPSDVFASLKIHLLYKKGYSFAFMPLATIPAGNPDYLLGDGSANYGALFLVSGTKGKVTWATNLGYLQRQEPLVFEDDRTKTVKVRGQVLAFGGAEYKATYRVSFAANTQLKVSTGEGVKLGTNSPSEWTTSVKYRPTTALDLHSGIGTGIGKGYGSPDYRVFAGVSYVPQQKRTYYRRVIAKKKK